jgi:hypothetical protein
LYPPSTARPIGDTARRSAVRGDHDAPSLAVLSAVHRRGHFLAVSRPIEGVVEADASNDQKEAARPMMSLIHGLRFLVWAGAAAGARWPEGRA